METKRFYRSRTDRVFAGVCGGLAEYFAIDPLLVRLLFIIFTIAAGGGVLVYIILWIITPEKPLEFFQPQNSATMENQQTHHEEPASSQENPKRDPLQDIPHPHRDRRNLIGGLVLITLGALFLADEFIPHISFGDLWPIILVVIGIGLLITSFSGRRYKN